MRQFIEQEARQILALAAEHDHAGGASVEERLTFEEIEEAARSAGVAPVHVRTAVVDFLTLERQSLLPVDPAESGERDEEVSPAMAVVGLATSLVGVFFLLAMWLGAIPSSGLWIPDPFLLTLAVGLGAGAYLRLRGGSRVPTRKGTGGLDPVEPVADLSGRRRMLRA